MHSVTFWNIQDVVEGCRKVSFQVDDGQTNGQTDRQKDLLSCVFAAKNIYFVSARLDKINFLLLSQYINMEYFIEKHKFNFRQFTLYSTFIKIANRKVSIYEK